MCRIFVASASLIAVISDSCALARCLLFGALQGTDIPKEVVLHACCGPHGSKSSLSLIRVIGEPHENGSTVRLKRVLPDPRGPRATPTCGKRRLSTRLSPSRVMNRMVQTESGLASLGRGNRGL